MLGFGDAEDHGSDGYWRGDEEWKAAATRGGRRSDGEVVEALVAEVDGEGLARRGRTRGAPTSGAEVEARGGGAWARDGDLVALALLRAFMAAAASC